MFIKRSKEFYLFEGSLALEINILSQAIDSLLDKWSGNNPIQVEEKEGMNERKKVNKFVETRDI